MSDPLSDPESFAVSFVVMVIRDMKPADQKRIILEARSQNLRLISDQQAENLIRELGLAEA